VHSIYNLNYLYLISWLPKPVWISTYFLKYPQLNFTLNVEKRKEIIYIILLYQFISTF